VIESGGRVRQLKRNHQPLAWGESTNLVELAPDKILAEPAGAS